MSLPIFRVDPQSELPVYRQIAEAVKEAARQGRLPGGRLPPTRELARDLGVNRNTVVAAYEELAAQGLVRARSGRGTFLVGATPGPVRPDGAGAEAPSSWATAFSRAVEGPGVGSLLSMYRIALSGEGISFAGSYPAADLMPVEAFGKALARALGERGPELLGYGPTAGFAPLRETIAASMRRKGSAVTADEILVTNGSQQALELVFRTLVDRADTVVLEDPSYTGALSVLASLGARLVGVPLDEEGIRPDLLELALERHRPRILYVQPTFHNPTTRVMGESRRREVLALAARYRCAVVEDDWAGDLRFEGRDLPSLHALDGGRQVIYLSTFSKKLLPGIRVGWVAAPQPVFERLVALKQISDCGTSPLVQAALDAFLSEGGLEAHLAQVLRAYRTRRDAMLAALERHFPSGARWSRPEGGLFVWVRLPDGFDARELFAAAREQGVLFSPGDVFHLEGAGRNTMRLTYAAVPPDAVERGVSILGHLLRERAEATGRRPARPAEEAVPIL